MRNRPRSRYGRRQLVSKSTEKILYKKKFSLKSFLAKAFLLTSVVFLAWFFLSGTFSVKAIDITGTNDLVGAKIQETVASYQGSIVRKNFYFVIPSSLEEYLIQKLPELKGVTVEKEYQAKALSIKASLREVSFNWVSLGVGYTVDRDGIVVAMESKPNIITISDETGQAYSIGDRVGDAELMLFINKLDQNFDSTGSKLTEVRVKNTYRKELTVRTAEGFDVIFNAERDPVVQINNLARVLQEIRKSGKKVEYVDLRIADRIFYK